jgi:phosphoribosylanthranilate isomerase
MRDNSPNPTNPRRFPQIKICGLTDPEQAAACARMGADAIGLVFHPPSPRNLSMDRAARITAALPAHVTAVGVFVDPPLELLLETITRCRLGAVQLHGAEPRALVDTLVQTHAVQVIKVLFAAKAPRMEDARHYRGASYLVECGRGAQPGGNALTWEWGAAAGFAAHHPTILAGGLNPDNVGSAITAALPDAVDVSSGLEAAPGRKDLDKAARFIAAVHQTANLYHGQGGRPRVIFGGSRTPAQNQLP